MTQEELAEKIGTKKSFIPGVESENSKILNDTILVIRSLAEKYNDMEYFQGDPIIFPRRFATIAQEGEATLQDVEISGILSAHLAWGKRELIIRDCERLFDEMSWKPFEYVMAAQYRNDSKSLHRTIKWCEMAKIFSNLREFYSTHESMEQLSAEEIRSMIFGQQADKKAANKKIHMFLRWMVRCDGVVDLGIWKSRRASELIIPLDVHVHRNALAMGITIRRSADIRTAIEITEYLKQIFPDDPCKGDFALFAYSASVQKK